MSSYFTPGGTPTLHKLQVNSNQHVFAIEPTVAMTSDALAAATKNDAVLDEMEYASQLAVRIIVKESGERLYQDDQVEDFKIAFPTSFLPVLAEHIAKFEKKQVEVPDTN